MGKVQVKSLWNWYFPFVSWRLWRKCLFEWVIAASYLFYKVNPEELKEGKDKFHFQRQIWVPLKEVLFIWGKQRHFLITILDFLETCSKVLWFPMHLKVLVFPLVSLLYLKVLQSLNESKTCYLLNWRMWRKCSNDWDMPSSIKHLQCKSWWT